jgi:hypothetical protein
MDASLVDFLLKKVSKKITGWLDLFDLAHPDRLKPQ